LKAFFFLRLQRSTSPFVRSLLKRPGVDPRAESSCLGFVLFRLVAGELISRRGVVSLGVFCPFNCLSWFVHGKCLNGRSVVALNSSAPRKRPRGPTFHIADHLITETFVRSVNSCPNLLNM